MRNITILTDNHINLIPNYESSEFEEKSKDKGANKHKNSKNKVNIPDFEDFDPDPTVIHRNYRTNTHKEINLVSNSFIIFI